MTAGETALNLEFPHCLAADFPVDLPVAERAVSNVLKAIANSPSFGPLEDRSPGLRGNDWANYLRCSEARMVHASQLMRRRGTPGGRVLDYGAYFGNFALMFQELGFAVDAVDAYASYRPSLDPVLDLLAARQIPVLDFSVVGRDLSGLPADSYDAVLLMGVIEHVPHTPRMLMESLDRVIKPGGLLILDTPNAVQLPNRQKFARGESIMPAIATQFHATVPFEGHHREYTVAEVLWMVQEIGHQAMSAELFNYSNYGQGRLSGRDVSNHWRMVANPDMRELILVASRKRADGAPAGFVDDWRTVLEETEQFWLRQLPPATEVEHGDRIVANELLTVNLQQGIDLRDRMLAEQQAEWASAVALRDHKIAAINARLGALQLAFDLTPSERIKRAMRRLGAGLRLSGGKP